LRGSSRTPVEHRQLSAIPASVSLILLIRLSVSSARVRSFSPTSPSSPAASVPESLGPVKSASPLSASHNRLKTYVEFSRFSFTPSKNPRSFSALAMRIRMFRAMWDSGRGNGSRRKHSRRASAPSSSSSRLATVSGSIALNAVVRKATLEKDLGKREKSLLWAGLLKYLSESS